MEKKNCSICDSEFEVKLCRVNSAKYCSKKCADIGLHAKNNCTCDTCGVSFHKKQSHILKSKNNYCSTLCLKEAKKVLMSGSGNHQFGLTGHRNSSFKGVVIPKTNHKMTDMMIYVENHPYKRKSSRIILHRHIVEQNYNLFNISFFIEIDGRFYLNPKYDVHHKDGNHNNNSIDNLEILTRGEHSRLHNMANPMKKDLKTGRFISR